MGNKLHLYHPSALESIAAPETIEELHLYANGFDGATLKILPYFECLKYLHLHAFQQIHQLAPILPNYKQLKGLFLLDVDWRPLRRQFDQLRHLKILSIHNDTLNELPEALIHMSQLEELELRFNRVSSSMPHWHLLEYLPQLHHLTLSHISSQQFPSDAIAELAQLNELCLSKNNLKKLTQKHPAFLTALPYAFAHSSLETKYFKKLLPKMRRENLPWEKRTIWLNLLANDTAKLDRLASQKDILEATEIQPATFSAIRLHALEYYQQRWSQQQQLNRGAHLTVVGTIATKKNVLRSQLKALNIQYSPKITQKTTHLLLGQRAQGVYHQALEQEIPILTIGTPQSPPNQWHRRKHQPSAGLI